MKKVLFATTALVATAGVAAADVSLSGRAEMGLFGGTGMETQFFTDIDVTFTMSGTTDNGLTFGASVDLDEGGAGAAAVANNADDGGATIFLSGNFGTITMGDTDGALDWAMTDAAVGNAGSMADDETTHAAYLGNYGDGAYDGQILRYDNTFGDIGVAVSVEMDDTGVLDTGFALGARYGMAVGGGTVDLGIGYQYIDVRNFSPGNSAAGLAGDDFDGEYDIFGVSAAYSANGLSVGITYTDFSSGDAVADDQGSHIGLGAGYTTGAITVSANYGMWDIDHDFGADDEITGFGLAAAYDLGGGAAIHAGYGTAESDINGDLGDTWSLGVAMSF